MFHTILDREDKILDKHFALHKILKLSNEGSNYIVNNYVGMNTFVEPKTFEEYIFKIKKRYANDKSNNEEIIKIKIKFVDDNINLFKSDYFANKLDISRNVDNKTFQKINNFIESGILINE